MTIVRFNQDTLEYDLVDARSGSVVESGFMDSQAASEVAAVYNESEV